MQIKFPKIVISDDYREFSYIKRMLEKFGVFVNYKEIDQNKVTYAAIFYIEVDDNYDHAINEFNRE